MDYWGIGKREKRPVERKKAPGAVAWVRKKTFSDGTPEVAYTYDSCPQGKGRLCSVGNSVSTTNYTAYDGLGRVTAGNQNTGGTAYSFGYAYNLLNGLTSMTYPSGRTVTYGYDGAGRVNAVAGYASGIQYAPHGAPSQVTLGNGILQTTAYNSRLQPTSIAAGSLLTLGFGYGTANNNGNVMSQTISVAGASATQSYAYDNLNRLSGASEGSTWSRTFGYDAYGNMWVDTNSGVAADSFTPRAGSWFNSSNRMVNGGLPIQYSGSGELQQIGGYGFTYDAESRLKTSALNGVTTTYSYDGEGRRVKKALAGGATTTYVYDAFGKLAAEYGGTVETGGTQYLTSDHLGSTRLVTNATGNMVSRHDYLPFGEEIPTGIGFRTTALGYAADGFPLKFTGKERDTESGLDYFGARYFSGAQGRFTSPDKQYFQAEMLADPQRFNLYAYARNNPLAFIDPTGEAIELSSDPVEREKQMLGLCGLIYSDVCKQYLYVDDKYKKGHYYVGILAGGRSGKGPDFGSLNGVTASLQDIIRDPHVATVEFVQGSDRIQMPPGIGPSLNINHVEGATTPFMNGQLHVYVRAKDDPTGYSFVDPWKMSNFWPGERDQNTVLAHELGHALYRMKAARYDESADNDSARDLENKVRQLKNPNAAVRTWH